MATIIIGSVAFSIGGAFMRMSDGFTRLWPSLIVATCFVVGAGFLAKAVNRGGLSTTYVDRARSRGVDLGRHRLGACSASG